MSTRTAVYFVSTPLHLFCACNIALNEKQEYSNHLIFIDQPDVVDNLYYRTILSWSQSPFETVNIFPGRVKGTVEKFRSRRKIFYEIEKFIECYPPQEIYVGNDRRIEFQYAMHLASKYQRHVLGVYMDEGMFSYIGRASSQSFSDRIVDNLLKKLTYGFWWKHPQTVGASDWIDKVYAAFPDLLHAPLKAKECSEIPSNYFLHPAITALSQQLLREVNVDIAQVSELDVLITLPHESLFKKTPSYLPRMKSLLESLLETGRKVGIKQHPRDEKNWIQDNLHDNRVLEVPRKVNFESLLLVLKPITLIGDYSSTLLTAKWLRSDISLLAIQPLEEKSEAFDRLFSELSIKQIPIEKAACNLVEFAS